MATHENVEAISVQVLVTASVPAALVNRFVTWKTSSPAQREVIQHVPGANGAPAVGLLSQKPDQNVKDGLVTCAMTLPNGGMNEVLLGENVTQGAELRIGGNSTEVDGAAYLADATGDYIVGVAGESGNAGEVITFQFLNKGIRP